MKARPLEAPQPFPTNLRPLVARFAGDAARASYTTGPATRDALAQAGALGATTGSVVHLPGAPSAVAPDVLAHELTHARQPVGRPRFLLHAQSGAMDADERAAHTVGQQVAVHRSFGGLGGLGSHAVPTPGSVTSGLVDQLPVGGASGNAVSEARAAEQGLAGSVPGLAGLNGPAGPAASDPTAHGLLAALAAADPSGAAAPAAVGAVGQSAADELNGLTGAARQAESAMPTAVAGHQGAATAAAAAPAHGPAATASAADIDRIVQAVEQRLLRQLERRGGRYAGVF